MKRSPSNLLRLLILPASLILAGLVVWFCVHPAQPELMSPRQPDNHPLEYAPPSTEPDSPQDPAERPSAASSAATPASAANDDLGKQPLNQTEVARKLAEIRAALNAAASITDLQKRNETLAQLCFHWAEFDPRGAVLLACNFHLDGGGVLENLTQQWAAADLQGAKSWVDTQSPGEAKSRLVARIGFLWAGSDPQAAADYVISQTVPGEIQTEAAISVLHQWAQKDRVAAEAWARSFPDGDLRDRALNEATTVVVTNN